jgi:hypothetical protein
MQIDMDSLLTRDPLPSPLPEHEFITQWDRYDTPSSPLSGMLMHFHDHLAYLCEAFHIISTSQPPQQSSTDWGSGLYLYCYGDGSCTARYRRSRFYRSGRFVFWRALCPMASLTDRESLPIASAACGSSIFPSLILALRVNPPSNSMTLALVQGMIRRLIYMIPLANLN